MSHAEKTTAKIDRALLVLQLIIAAIIGLFVFLPSSAQAKIEDWNTTDKTLLVATEIGYYLDFRQTREIALNPINYYEHNPLLGRHPSVGKVNNYFLATAVGTYFLADALPPKYRRLFLSGALAVEVVTVAHNHKLGLRYNF